MIAFFVDTSSQEDSKVFIELSLEKAGKITVVNEKGVLRFVTKSDTIQDKTSYSGVIEKEIKEKYKVGVAVTKGVKVYAKRTSVYLRCIAHKINVNCWISNEDLKEHSILQMFIHSPCEKCFPQLEADKGKTYCQINHP